MIHPALSLLRFSRGESSHPLKPDQAGKSLIGGVQPADPSFSDERIALPVAELSSFFNDRRSQVNRDSVRNSDSVGFSAYLRSSALLLAP